MWRSWLLPVKQGGNVQGKEFGRAGTELNRLSGLKLSCLSLQEGTTSIVCLCRETRAQNAVISAQVLLWEEDPELRLSHSILSDSFLVRLGMARRVYLLLCYLVVASLFLKSFPLLSETSKIGAWRMKLTRAVPREISSRLGVLTCMS